MTRQILALGEYLERQQVTCVVMEATSDYRKPFYYVPGGPAWSRARAGERAACQEPAGA